MALKQVGLISTAKGWHSVWHDGDPTPTGKGFFTAPAAMPRTSRTGQPDVLVPATDALRLRILLRHPDFVPLDHAGGLRLALRDRDRTRLVGRIYRPNGASEPIVYVEDEKYAASDPRRYKGHFWLSRIGLSNRDFAADWTSVAFDGDSLARLRAVAEIIAPGLLERRRHDQLAAVAAEQRRILGPAFSDLIAEVADIPEDEAYLFDQAQGGTPAP